MNRPERGESFLRLISPARQKYIFFPRIINIYIGKLIFRLTAENIPGIAKYGIKTSFLDVRDM